MTFHKNKTVKSSSITFLNSSQAVVLSGPDKTKLRANLVQQEAYAVH